METKNTTREVWDIIREGAEFVVTSKWTANGYSSECARFTDRRAAVAYVREQEAKQQV
jgi:hypothetical protein